MADATTLFRHEAHGTVACSAQLSDDRRYRWLLTRRWDRSRPILGWVMLNPSTADQEVDDPTIRRCIGFARSQAYGGIAVVNLFGWRATDPDELTTIDDPVGMPDYDNPLAFLPPCQMVVAAWGSAGDASRTRVDHVVEIAAHTELRLWCLGTTATGQPRHPLYVRADTPIIPWKPS